MRNLRDYVKCLVWDLVQNVAAWQNAAKRRLVGRVFGINPPGREKVREED